MTGYEAGYADAHRESRVLTITMLLVLAVLIATLVLPDDPVVKRLSPSPAACQAAAEADLEARAARLR